MLCEAYRSFPRATQKEFPLPAFANATRKGSRGGCLPAREPKKAKTVTTLADLALVVGPQASAKSEHKLRLLTDQSTTTLVPVGKPSSRKVTELGIYQPICLICRAEPVGYYGRWGDSGTCSLACEQVQRQVPRY